MSQLTNLQRVMMEEHLPSASISFTKTKLSALVIAHAILNPYKTKYFQYPQWGHISDPETVLDVHGRVMVWYLPGIIPPQRVVKQSLLQYSPPLKSSLVTHSKRKNESSKRFGHRHVPELDGTEADPLAGTMFGHGRLMNSPAVFQQAHMRFQDKVYESSTLKFSAVKKWLQDISYAEEFWNSILILIGKDAIAAKEDWVVTPTPFWVQVAINLWFSSLPAGLGNLGTIFGYHPGTMIYLAGKLLSHSVPKWEKRERIALAHYMRDAIHNRFGMAWPAFTQQKELFIPNHHTYFPQSMQQRRAKVLSKRAGRSSLYTFQPTKTRRGKVTYKEIDARHLYLPSGSQPSACQTPRTAASSQSLGFSGFDWNEVEDAPQPQRFTKSQNDFITEWLPWRAKYLNVILEGEQLEKGGICPKVEWYSLPGYFLTWLLVAHGPWGRTLPPEWDDSDPEELGYVTGGGPPNHRKSSGFQMTIVHTEDASECKTSAMSFYQKLKRFTNNAFPERNKIQEMEDLPSFALPAPNQVLICLQTGEPNMTAQHMKMNKPESGVALSDGKGYMVSEGPYQSHLQQSLDSKERSTCSNHQAINAANINKSNLQSTGIDFQKGERYMNTDYSICNALGNCSESITKSLVIYDVGCQWSVNFRTWVKSSPSLFLPPVLEIIPAVGKFHLVAHKLSCFPRYSLNFVKGAGHLDGEILETLWAPFNKISPTARSMTQAHRQEVYDDHMRDSNWKKLVGIVPSLLKKYKMANKFLEEMNQAYEQLTAGLDPDKVAQWELDALRAEADREEALDIYLLKEDKAPSFHEVQLKLAKHPKAPSGNFGSVAWLAEGISIEDSQDQLRSELHQLPSPMSTRQEVKTSEKRQRLSARIEKFHSNGQAFFKSLEIDGTFIAQDDPAFCGKDEEEDLEFWDDDEREWQASEEDVEELASELMSIWMPSSIGAAKLMELGLHDLLKEERELRIGQANDCLDQLRTDLGNKAMEGTRAKKEIQKVVARVNKHVRSCQRARQAILWLDPDVNMAQKYQEIRPEDLAVSKEVTEENRFGQGTSKLAWFWMMDGEQTQLNEESGGLMQEFYQINWLKARARRDRWKEEVSLVRHEMLWTGLWFKHHKNIWEKRALQSTEPGKGAYANKQIELWRDFVSEKNYGHYT
ncbi:hypothetical protein EDC04DRAFT_2616638 [Pisolithus marmoratus]|nr:hypothetical protein EDC04DRAFT_2616638 [Pisolithus marmoratus]